MKTKSFAMLAMTGLLAVSCLYISPAMAEETDIGGTQAAAPSDQISSPTDVSNTSSTDTMNVDNSNVNSSNADQGSPDTATGDDDY